MKFKNGQIVFCDVFGGFHKIEASKEQPYERTIPFRQIITVQEPYDYIIMPFKEFLENGDAWFVGEAEVKEDWLEDATAEFEKFWSDEMAKRNTEN